MHKLNPRTAALLSAFGWAVGYLLAGKALAVLLPMPPGGAAKVLQRIFHSSTSSPSAARSLSRARISRARNAASLIDIMRAASRWV